MENGTEKDPARRYAESVEQERAAWEALHACPPGSPERLQAWNDWDQAIGRTNRAWRNLSASRLGMPAARPLATSMRSHAVA